MILKKCFFYLISFSLLLCVSSVFSQKIYTVKGLVTESGTALPIRNVHVVSQESNTGTITDSKGGFTLKLDRVPTFLLFTHVSFEDRILIVSKKTTRDSLKVVLSPRTEELKAAVVTGKKVAAFKRNEYTVIDFDFIGSEILILGRNHTEKRFELFLSNVAFDTLKFMPVSRSIKAREIFRDCMGNCHIITNNKSYQVVSQGSLLYLHDAVDLDEFRSVMSMCEFETDDHMVFKRPTSNKYDNDYFAIHKKGRKKEHFIRSFDYKRQRALNERKLFLYKHKEFAKYGRGGNIRFEEDIMFKPAYCELELIGDSIYFFDHSKGCIELYGTDLKLIEVVDISYHNYKKWLPEIYTDEISGRSYTIMENGAKKDIYEIDLEKGHIEFVFTVPIVFPRKLRINNGYVYALHKDFSRQFDWKGVYFYKIAD